MYTGELRLVTKNSIPLSLADNFDNTFELIDSIKDCKSSNDLCKIVNNYHIYGYHWSIDKDCKENTRLISKDTLGNIKYLIVKKCQKVEVVGSNMKEKIIDTMIWYKQTDDKNDVIMAREYAQVLYNLLKEIITQ